MKRQKKDITVDDNQGFKQNIRNSLQEKEKSEE